MLQKARIFSVPFGLSFWSQSILVLVTALLSLVDDAIIPCLDVFELLLLIELVYQELFFLFDVLSPFLSRPVVALVFIIFFFIIYSIWRVFRFY